MKDDVLAAKKLLPNRSLYRVWIALPGLEDEGRFVTVAGQHSLTNELLKVCAEQDCVHPLSDDGDLVVMLMETIPA